jgi:PAS domain S-box-containing protein
MFSIAFIAGLFSILYYAVVSPNITNEPLILKNLYYWSTLPIVISIFHISHYILFDLKKFSLFFNSFIFFLVFSFIFIMVLPFPAKEVFSPIIIAAGFEIITVSFLLLLLKRELTDFIFLLAVICFMIAGVATAGRFDLYFQLFSFFMGYTFLLLIFAFPNQNRTDPNSGMGTIFSLHKQLTETTETFETLFNQMVDGVVIVDKKGKMLATSDRICETVGVKREDFIGKNFLSTSFFDGKTKRELIKNLILRMAGKHIAPYEVTVYQADGTPVPFEIHAGKVTYNGKPADMVVFRDLRDRKKAEKETQEKQEELELLNSINTCINEGLSIDYVIKIISKKTGQLFKSHNASVYLLSNDKKHLVTNSSCFSNNHKNIFKKITGEDIGELEIPLTEDNSYPTIINNSPKIYENKEELIEIIKGFTNNQYVKKLTPKVIELLEIKSLMSIPLVANEECFGIINISGNKVFSNNDLQRFVRIANQLSIALMKVRTEKKLVESYQELKELNLNLEQKVIERTENIQHLLQQKDAFISQLGHDLKTPLGPLINLLPLVEKKTYDPKIKEILNVTIKASYRINNLVKKIIRLAQLNSTHFELNFEKTRLFDQIEETIERNNDLINKSNIVIANKINKDFTLEMDLIQISELFDNLLVNAIKYSSNGGTITFEASNQEDNIIVAVKDEGIGLTKKEIKYIFDEFYKVDASRHDLESHGLGMTISKKIVEKHGGKIWAESKGLGKGSTFYFSIPKTHQLHTGNKNNTNISYQKIINNIDSLFKKK